MTKYIIVVVLLLSVTHQSAAEMYQWTETIGHSMCRSDCVVRGVIISVDRVPSPDPAEKGPSAWMRVQLDVRETIIGARAANLVFFLDFVDRDSRIPEWTKIKSEQIFFLVNGAPGPSHNPGRANILKMDAWAAMFQSPIPITPELFHDPVIADDLRLLTTTDEVLTEARRISKMHWVPGAGISILPPDDVKKRLGLPEYGWLELGVNDETFTSAREWIKSPDTQMQWCGAEVLVRQKSPENIAALVPFAKSMRESARYGPEARARLLCRLNEWGVTDLPSLIKPSPIFDVHRPIAWISLGGWLLPPLCYIVLTIRRRTRILIVIWWMVVSALVVLDVRSYWPQDAVTRGSIDVALERGNIYVEHQERTSAGLPSPFTVCEPKELLANQRATFWAPMYQNGKLNDRGEPYDGSLDIFDRKSFAERFWPTMILGTIPIPGSETIPWRARYQGPVWQLPIWLPLTLLVVPRIWFVFWRWLRCRNQRTRGFPVYSTEAGKTGELLPKS